MQGGLFQQWQPVYAEAGVATFPVRDKRPAVKHWLKAGIRASAQFRSKGSFASDDAFGFACRRSKVTIFDYDAPDERGFRDCLDEIGDTPLIVRTASGNFHAYYANRGEKRLVRPDKTRPFDILGDGFAVAPPSRTAKGASEIINGSLDDLHRLPPMRPMSFAVDETPAPVPERALSDIGERDGRNDTLFRRLRGVAQGARNLEEVMTIAAEINGQFAAPLGGDEVARVAASIWRYKSEGRLFAPGGEATAVVGHSDMEHLHDAPNAVVLLLRLRMAHSHRNGKPFALARETADVIGVSYPTYRAARDVLVERRFIEIIHPGGKGKNDPPQARLL
jgi:hypothetical protein